MARKITLVTGGQRSGKSTYAEQLALSASNTPVYMATARIWDGEFRERVLAHQRRRGPEWTNIEEEKFLSRHDMAGRVVLVDCVTLWCTNFYFDCGNDIAATAASVTEEFEHLIRQDTEFIFVTNEIGWGGTPVNDVQRHFTDLLGKVNQHIASRADEVILMVSGVPVKIK